MVRQMTLCTLGASAALAVAGCATTAQPAQTTTPAGTTPPPASTTPASTTPSPPPIDTGALKREAFKTCSQSTPDDLRARYNSPTSNPVDIADAYARTFASPQRVAVAEGCFQAITQQTGP